jgi:hypothetical protein
MITEEELGVLRLADTYGDGLDLSGPRVTRSVKNVVRDLLGRGLLVGELSNFNLTDSGRDALKAAAPRIK